MNLKDFSLIYPSIKHQKNHFDGKDKPDIDMYVLDRKSVV